MPHASRARAMMTGRSHDAVSWLTSWCDWSAA
jgi:hypothetical protein